MPNRARSYRAPPAAIISIAQQASPKVAGQKLALRVQFTSFSTVVSRMPLGSFSSMPMWCQPSVPVESATPPDVGVRDEHRADEQQHLDEPEQAQRVERHRPRVQEDDLDIEDDEQHRRHGEQREQQGKREQAHDRYPQSERHDQLRLVLPQLFPLANNLLAALCDVARGVSGAPHAAGARRLSPLMIRSIASPPRGSVRFAISFSTNRMSTGCGSACRVPILIS